MVAGAGGAALRNSRVAENPGACTSCSSKMRRAAAGALAAAARGQQRRWAAAAAAAAPTTTSATATLTAWQRGPPSLLLTGSAAAAAYDRRRVLGGFELAPPFRPRPLSTAAAARAAAAPATAAAAASPAADAAPKALPAAGDYAALRRLTQLHNTMSRTKEPFVPASISPARPRARQQLVSPDRRTAPGAPPPPSTAASLASAADAAFSAAEARETATSTRPKVTMYVCGVTAYDLSHIGHARAYVAFDLLLRLLTRACGYDVRYVRNFTDVDDKIIARAAAVQAEQRLLPGGNGEGVAAASAPGDGGSGGNGSDTPVAAAAAAVSAEDAHALASRFIDEFRADMESLGCLPPTDEPRATEYVPQMVETIERIVAHGHAYATRDGSGDVFFDVRSLPGYGLLSGRTDASVNRAGASERVAQDSRKRDAADFALWKGARAGEPSWPSPWGGGRPGWHVECSAMIRAVLGEAAIDVHGGGRDLVFPHHENELAQSRAALGPCACCEADEAPGPGQEEERGRGPGGVGGAAHEGAEGAAAAASASAAPTRRPKPLPPPEEREFVRYWVHNGFVNVDSEKMSKSLGNFFTIRDAARSHGAPALRWLLVGSHYRQPLQYTGRALDEAADRLYYVYQALADADAALAEAAAEAAEAAAAAAVAPAATAATDGASSNADNGGGGGKKKKAAPATAAAPPPSPAEALAAVLAGQCPGGALASAASAALADDLGAPAAVGALSPALKALNDLLHTRAGRRAAGRPALLASYRAGLSYVLDDLLGFDARDPQASLAALRAAALARAGLTEEGVARRVAARAEARAAKDFAAADAVRAELAAKGVFLMDAASGGGSAWRPGVPEAEEGEEGA